jgi:hypothetical protein
VSPCAVYEASPFKHRSVISLAAIKATHGDFHQEQHEEILRSPTGAKYAVRNTVATLHLYCLDAFLAAAHRAFIAAAILARPSDDMLRFFLVGVVFAGCPGAFVVLPVSTARAAFS